MRVLILGASGQFGKRLCQRLAQEELTLLLGGRNLDKLNELRRHLTILYPTITIEDPVQCDVRQPNFSDLLSALNLNLVIHLAGPFQGQGYQVAKACLAAGVSYIDMADGREFVANFQTLDAEAKQKGIFLITGASTVPALSSAIIDHVMADIPVLEDIDYGIAAGLKTGLGAATLQAVLSYCGKPYTSMNKTIYGLSEPRSYYFAPPVGRRSLVNCDIPDFALFPSRYSSLRKMRFGSCIDVAGLTWVLSVMSKAVQKGWIKDWVFLSGMIVSFMRVVRRMGSSHSGFFMSCAGQKNGAARKALFEIVAHDGCGLEIPVTPVVLLIKKLLAGKQLAKGAYPCVGLISLTECEQELAEFPISFNWLEFS